MSDLLDVGARWTLPDWATPVLVLVAALGIAAWTLLTALPPTVDGHGSRPEPPVSVPYQPLLGRPLI